MHFESTVSAIAYKSQINFLKNKPKTQLLTNFDMVLSAALI